MKLEKILLYVEPKANIELISQFTINLAQQNNARVFALSMIPHSIPQIKTRLDEQAWKRLYEIEEDAFEAGIKISLLLEELEKMNRENLTQKLIDISKSFQVDAVIFYSTAKININKLIGEIKLPVYIIPSSAKSKTELRNDSLQEV